MVKQVKIIYVSDGLRHLEEEINTFCVDFFPEEIFSINIYPPRDEGDMECVAMIVYQKDEYEENS